MAKVRELHSHASMGRPWHAPTGFVFVFLTGMNVQIVGNITTALISAVAIFPVLIGEYVKDRKLWPIGVLYVCGVASAIVLFALSPETHSARSAVSVTVWFSGGILAIGVILWANRYISIRTILIAYSAGWLIQVLIEHENYSANFWKYGISQPLTIGVLALVGSSPFPVRVLVAVILTWVGFEFESRSFGAICVVAFIVSELQRRDRSSVGHSTPAAGKSFLFAGAAFITVWVVSVAIVSVLTSGVFGEEVRARTLRQESGPGGLLLGGRPEWVASISLMTDRPFGYGAGAMPGEHDYILAMQAIADAGLVTAGSYYRQYMFAGDFRLHSVLADLWLSFSIPGALLALVMAARIALLFIGRTGGSGASVGSVCFLSLSSLWFVFFGTFYSNFPQVAFAVAVAAVVSRHQLSVEGDGASNTRQIPVP